MQTRRKLYSPFDPVPPKATTIERQKADAMHYQSIVDAYGASDGVAESRRASLESKAARFRKSPMYERLIVMLDSEDARERAEAERARRDLGLSFYTYLDERQAYLDAGGDLDAAPEANI